MRITDPPASTSDVRQGLRELAQKAEDLHTRERQIILESVDHVDSGSPGF